MACLQYFCGVLWSGVDKVVSESGSVSVLRMGGESRDKVGAETGNGERCEESYSIIPD